MRSTNYTNKANLSPSAAAKQDCGSMTEYLDMKVKIRKKGRPQQCKYEAMLTVFFSWYMAV